MARTETSTISGNRQHDLASETESSQAEVTPFSVELSPRTEKFFTPENVKKIKIKVQTFFSQPLSSLPADKTSLVKADPRTPTPIPPEEPIKTKLIITISFFNGLRARRIVSPESTAEMCAYLEAWEEEHISRPLAQMKEEINEALSDCRKIENSYKNTF